MRAAPHAPPLFFSRALRQMDAATGCVLHSGGGGCEPLICTTASHHPRWNFMCLHLLPDTRMSYGSRACHGAPVAAQAVAHHGRRERERVQCPAGGLRRDAWQLLSLAN